MKIVIASLAMVATINERPPTFAAELVLRYANAGRRGLGRLAMASLLVPHSIKRQTPCRAAHRDALRCRGRRQLSPDAAPTSSAGRFQTTLGKISFLRSPADILPSQDASIGSHGMTNHETRGRSAKPYDGRSNLFGFTEASNWLPRHHRFHDLGVVIPGDLGGHRRVDDPRTDRIDANPLSGMLKRGRSRQT